MRLNQIIFILLLLTQISCTDRKTNDNKKNIALLADTIPTISKAPSKETFKPIFGYRFIVTGDFNGDGKKEKLVEHFFSRLDNKETNKFYGNDLDYDDLIELTIKKKPYSFLASDDKNVSDFTVSLQEQQFGLSYLKNEGDLNGDGTDEISYVTIGPTDQI